MLRYFSIVFLALTLAVTVTYREGFFRLVDHDEGDDAANALQIHRAKHLRELHGNYSRWGFHHPGPAFFYVYALGEGVLYDALHVSPTPRAAHIYTGTLLQLAFFAMALALVCRHARQPVLVLALGIALAGWHYAHVDRAVYSVWPPDVLLMPMLCFVVSCAATAMGDRIALPLLILSGSFLVHGHVAQPLFVVPMAIAAVVCAVLQPRRRLGELLRSGAGITSLALLGLFLLPIVLDLLAGKQSNAHDILVHLKYETDGGRSLAQSFLCYASYFVGMNDPTMFNQISESTRAPFVDNAALLAAWAAMLSFAIWALFRKARCAAQKDSGRFGRRLLWFWLSASALTLVWGMRQDGGFTNFNSHFNHSLVFVVALLGVVGLTRLLPPTSKAFQWVLFGAAIPVFALGVQFQPDPWSRGAQIAARMPGLLRADPKPAAPKLITFADGDAPDWYEAVTIARDLQRRGIPFYVGADWAIMFGVDKVFENQGDVLAHGGVSVWRVVSRKVAPPEAHVVSRESAITFPGTPELPLPVRLEFANAKGTPAALVGLDSSEGEWAWTTGHLVAFQFNTAAASTTLELAMDASGNTSSALPRQRVTILVNGRKIGETTFTSGRRTVPFPVDAALWNSRSPRTIAFELPDATAPAQIANSGDRRVLGLRLYSLTVSPKVIP